MKTIIIGGGPGGYELAALLAAKREEVVLIERDRLGGTCLNRGCIPTKVMAHAADVALECARAAASGLLEGAASAAVSFGALCARRDEVVNTLRQGVEGLMRGVDVRHATARLLGPTSVEADGEVLTADRIVIATGSAPALPPIPGAETAMTSDTLLRLTERPASLVIVGGGVIGMEFASIFAALGTKVTVVEYCKEILPPFDRDIARRLRTQLTQRGIDIVVSAQVTRIDSDGRRVAYVKTPGGEETLVSADAVVIATGRRPVLPEGLDAAGVEYTRKGITVDPRTLATNVPTVYAIGDCNGLCMLAHAASAQARVLAGEEVNLDVVPSVVFTMPEAAMAGLTEQQCKDAGIPVKTSKALFRANGKAMAMEQTEGIVKLIAAADGDRRLLGVHILGPHAASLVMEPALAIANGLPASAIARTIHPHPTLAEALAAAAH